MTTLPICFGRSNGICATAIGGVKIKIEPGRDVELVKAARKSSETFRCLWTRTAPTRFEDLDIFRELDEFGLMMFEQPFPGPALEELAELQRPWKRRSVWMRASKALSCSERAISWEVCGSQTSRSSGSAGCYQGAANGTDLP